MHVQSKEREVEGDPEMRDARAVRGGTAGGRADRGLLATRASTTAASPSAFRRFD